jgi:hypothetical protein
MPFTTEQPGLRRQPGDHLRRPLAGLGQLRLGGLLLDVHQLAGDVLLELQPGHRRPAPPVRPRGLRDEVDQVIYSRVHEAERVHGHALALQVGKRGLVGVPHRLELRLQVLRPRRLAQHARLGLAVDAVPVSCHGEYIGRGARPR